MYMYIYIQHTYKHINHAGDQDDEEDEGEKGDAQSVVWLA